MSSQTFCGICLKKLHFMDPEDPYSDPDHFQNSIISSFYLFRHILKIHQNPFISFSFILYINTSGSLDPDDPDHSQNLITCSLSHLGHFLKISSKSTHDFLSYLSLKLYFMDPQDPDSGPDHSQN